VGFKQSEVNPCLVISEKVICLVYVDDTLFFSPNLSDIDRVLKKLKGLKIELNIEDDVAGFLGVLIKKLDEGSIELTHTGLIKRVLEAMGIEGANPKLTPAETEALPSDKTGSLTEPPFNYASVYLQGYTRPVFSFSVSQCGRYIHRHANMHITALKRIGRYLLKTSEKGIILKPSSELTVDCYVDADFAGLWNREDHNEKTVSRAEPAKIYASVNVRYFGLLVFKMVLLSALWKQNMYPY